MSETTRPGVTATAPPRSPVAPALLLVLVVLAFFPARHLPSFDVVKLAVLTLGAAVLGFVAARRRDPDARETLLRDPLLLLPAGLSIAAAAGAIAAWPVGSLAGPATALTALAVGRLAASGPDAVRALLVTSRAAAAASAAVGAYALLQRAGLDPTPWGDRREVVSTLGNASFAAEWQAAALPLCVSLVLPGNLGRDRALGIAGAALAAVHLVLARSRIDLLAAGAGAVVLALVLLRERRARIAVGAGAVVVGLGVAALFVAAASGTETFVGRADTITVRLRVWEGAVRAFLAAPLRLGGAPFIETYPPFRAAEEYRLSLGRDATTPHNDLLGIAGTCGIVGLAVALTVGVLLVRRLVAAAGTDRRAAATLAASATALAVSGLASSPLDHPGTALLGALLLAHAAALAPRPLAIPFLGSRGADLAGAAVALLAFTPGPAFSGFRSDLFLALGREARGAGNAARALSLLDKSAASDAQAYTARYELGTALLHTGSTPEALAALRSAHEIRPHDPACRVNLVYALRSAGLRDEARALLEDSLREVPWHPLLLTARASEALDRDDAAAALADLDRAVPLMEAFDLRPAAVRAEARLAVRADEDSRSGALEILIGLHRRGDATTLRRAAAAFVRRDPVFLAVLGTRATRLVETDPAAAAALALAPILESAPVDAGYLETAARVLRRAGRAEEATRLTGRADGERARSALAAGNLADALRLAKSAGTRDPSASHFLLEARCHARYGERGAVREALAAAVAAGPVDPEAVRADAGIAALLPDADIERTLERALPPAVSGGVPRSPRTPPLSSGDAGSRR